MIDASDQELNDFFGLCITQKFERSEIIGRPGIVPNEIFFINRGLIRVIVTDKGGVEHSLNFALENQFIADYAAFILKPPSLYTIQTQEYTDVVVLPRAAVDWGYKNLRQGDRLGRLIAEFYFIYQDNRINNLYSRTPKERYDPITEVNLMIVWPQVSGLIAATVACFALSHHLFMRREVRS